MNCKECSREVHNARSLSFGLCHTCYKRRRTPRRGVLFAPPLDGAACAGSRDPEVFFAYDLRDHELRDALTAAALRTCGRCPVREACAEWAVRHERHGVWGGMTPTERARLRVALARGGTR